MLGIRFRKKWRSNHDEHLDYQEYLKELEDSDHTVLIAGAGSPNK